jgi:hypothetical protein
MMNQYVCINNALHPAKAKISAAHPRQGQAFGGFIFFGLHTGRIKKMTATLALSLTLRFLVAYALFKAGYGIRKK